MACERKKTIPSSDPDNVVQIQLSDYARRLDGKVREHYLKKISTIGIDPALIEGKHFEPDCVPPVESTDLVQFWSEIILRARSTLKSHERFQTKLHSTQLNYQYKLVL